MRPVWQISQIPYRFGVFSQHHPVTNFNIIPPSFVNSAFNILPNHSRCCSNRILGTYQIARPTFNYNLQTTMEEEHNPVTSDQDFKDDENHASKRALSIGDKDENVVNSSNKILHNTDISKQCKILRREGLNECFSPILTNIGFGSPSNFIQMMHFHTSSNPPKLDLDEISAEKQKDVVESWSLEMMNERMLNLRRWEIVAKPESPEDCQEFSLMSYNVLAQSLLEGNQYLYGHCNPEILNWSYRQERLFNEIINSKTDIFCLQEVEETNYINNFKPFFINEGFSSIYKKRTGSKNDGCAIFYKTSVFKLENWVAVEYNKPGVWVLDRDNIGIVALFRPVKKPESTNRICVATTHLLFNPRRGDVKLAQLQVLLAEIDNLAFKRTSSSGKAIYHPVILCGDMNSEPYCEIYNFLTTGAINYSGLPIATMSGQAEGNWYRNRRHLSCELLPAWLGITDNCQFFQKFSERFLPINEKEEINEPSPNELVNSSSESHISNDSKFSCCKSSSEEENKNFQTSETEENEGSVNQTESSKQPHCIFTPEQLKSMFSSGQMMHNLKLLSVYKHELVRVPGEREITTQHTNASCTVDYIFYSVKKKLSYVQNSKVKHQHVKENNLKLLAYYGLLSGQEVRELGGLPNAISPSDHLPLIAKFSLKL